MSEIKFRAWDKQDKKMINWDILGYTPNYGYSYYCLAEILKGDTNLIPMQYTGLKDKNGEEIYEGDIFIYKDMRLVVQMECGAFVGSFNGSNEFILINDFPNNDIEIIGNKHENKELLCNGLV